MTLPVPHCTPELLRSHDFCARVTRRQARNFYYGLRLLPEPKRSAMFALYAWMRRADDLVDSSPTCSPEQRKKNLEQFRLLTHAHTQPGAPPVTSDGWAGWPAFAQCVAHFNVPLQLLDDMIDGQQRDLLPVQMNSFEDLQHYCYQVAGVVGVASIYIWGFSGESKAQAMAIDRGLAFQLTNILRDLYEDLKKNRMYLPQREFDYFHVRPADVLDRRRSTQFKDFILWQVQRADEYYRRSAGLDQLVSEDSRAALDAMTAIYQGILRKIERDPFRVLRGRVRLGALSKARIAWRALRRGRQPKAH